MRHGDLGRLSGLQGTDAEMARRVLIAGPGNLVTFTLQSKTRRTYGALALAASRGRYGMDSLLQIASREQVSGLTEEAEFGDWNFRALRALAAVLAAQAETVSDHYDSVKLFKLAMRHGGIKAMSQHERLVFLESLSWLGFASNIEKYARLFGISRFNESQTELLLANCIGLSSKGPLSVSNRRWLDLVNAQYRRLGLETISFAPGDESPMDRIICGPSEWKTSGPKVTVIVPTFNSGPRIGTALRSLIQQTWRNLEILIMDDASPVDNDINLQKWAARDERIRIHRMDVNGGTYRARNFALKYLASGEFVTVHDDDDWSHPRKIETQVEHLLAHPDVVANVSLLARATSELRFGRINNNPVFAQKNYSSLMFRREPVLEKVGYWDLTNRSADAEFHDRLQRVFNQPVATAGDCILSFLRIRENSLTSGEINRGYIDPRRLWYQQSYRHWYERSENLEDLRMEPGGFDARPFSTPVSLLGSKQVESVVDVDVLYVTDFRFPGGNTSLSVSEIRLLVDMGLKVGLMQMASPVNGAQSTINGAILDVASELQLPVVSSLDPVTARLTIVRHPSVLQYAPLERSLVATSRLVIVVNHAPTDRNGLGQLYYLPNAIRTAGRVFGTQPLVAAESGAIREQLVGLVAPCLVAKFAWSGVVPWVGEARTWSSDLPLVIGRHSRDQAVKWPGTARDILDAYPDSREFSVKILGGARSAEAVLGYTPANWEVHEFGAVPPREFLRGVPFWVYAHHGALVESFGMATVEALASGCIVILPEYMRPTFGDAALYAEPSEVKDLIRRIARSPEFASAQSRRAVELVRREFSREAFRERVRQFLPGAA